MTSQLLSRPTRPQATCADCLSDDLAVVFGHDCPNDPRTGTPQALVATRPSDNVDAPRRGTGHGSRPAEPATEAQVRWLRKLLAERPDMAAAWPHPEALTKADASRIIDVLVAERKAQAMQPASTPTATPARRNRYAGTCTECGQQVAAEAGFIAKGATGWTVKHEQCPEAPAPAPQAPQATSVPQVPAGHYAIASTGANDLAFYRVDHGKGEWAGRIFVSLVVGGKPDRNVRRDAVAGILARIAADPQAAARYGQELGQCSRCNRHLTDEVSRSLGIGPECRSK